jgi:hypothetical protein
LSDKRAWSRSRASAATARAARELLPVFDWRRLKFCCVCGGVVWSSAAARRASAVGGGRRGGAARRGGRWGAAERDRACPSCPWLLMMG